MHDLLQCMPSRWHCLCSCQRAVALQQHSHAQKAVGTYAQSSRPTLHAWRLKSTDEQGKSKVRDGVLQGLSMSAPCRLLHPDRMAKAATYMPSMLGTLSAAHLYKHASLPIRCVGPWKAALAQKVRELHTIICEATIVSLQPCILNGLHLTKLASTLAAARQAEGGQRLTRQSSTEHACSMASA